MLCSVPFSRSSSTYKLNKSLQQSDPVVYGLTQEEMFRQKQGLELIASENFTSKATLTALSSHFNNKYAEGYPYARHYGGNEVVDKLEVLAQERALAAFHLDPKEWGVNVQAMSGSPANFAVYTALLQPGDTLMGLACDDGGHISHGYETKTCKVSASSLYWKSVPYTVNPKTCLIDYEKLLIQAREVRPSLIIAGISAYTRHINYQAIRKACDEAGAIMMSDIAHISGLVAAQLSPDPFKYSDVVTTTTHKTLRGPRGALIFYRKKYEKQINQAVFPGLQGGPHVNEMAGITVALGEALQDDFKQYQKQTLSNMQTLCDEMINKQVKLVTGGTVNHMALLDLRSQGIDGDRLEYVLEKMNISANKTTIIGGSVGLRVGSPALTTRGFKNDDFKKVARFIIDGINISQRLKSGTGNNLENFKSAVLKDAEIQQKKKEIISFASQFPLPGLDE